MSVRRVRPGSRQHGFTLIDVITAIMLTAIVVAIAASALSAATDARATIERHQITLEAESRWRAAVTDMLRHAPPADAVSEPLLRITRDARGNAMLVFLSTGVAQPFGTGRIWRVTIVGGASGLVLDAEPIGRGMPAASLRTVLPHLMLRDVAVLDANAGSASWRGDWPVERTRPSLLRLEFLPAAPANDVRIPDLVVSLAPLVGASVGNSP